MEPPRSLTSDIVGRATDIVERTSKQRVAQEHRPGRRWTKRPRHRALRYGDCHHYGMGHGHAVQEELREPARALRRAIPGVYDGYRQLHAAAYAAGALDEKTKELIALAIAVSKECDGCIASHARGAVRTGATESEVAEALGVAIAMNGGPGTVYGPRAFAAFREFAEEADHKQG